MAADIEEEVLIGNCARQATYNFIALKNNWHTAMPRKFIRCTQTGRTPTYDHSSRRKIMIQHESTVSYLVNREGRGRAKSVSL